MLTSLSDCWLDAYVLGYFSEGTSLSTAHQFIQLDLHCSAETNK